VSETNSLLLGFGGDCDLLRPRLRPVRLQAGQILSEPGDDLRTVYFLQSGLVSKVALFDDGTEIECVVVGKEGAVGAMAALGLHVALTRDVCHWDAKALAVDVSDLRQAVSQSSRIAAVMNQYCVWKMTCAIRNGACNAVHNVERRLARWLLTCCDVLGHNEIHLSQDVLAKMLGASRTSVNPHLRNFRTHGLIYVKRHEIGVADRSGLLERACPCYADLAEIRRYVPIMIGDGSPPDRRVSI
jgi:CRP-like cAMP-binding protein